MRLCMSSFEDKSIEKITYIHVFCMGNPKVRSSSEKVLIKRRLKSIVNDQYKTVLHPFFIPSVLCNVTGVLTLLKDLIK